VHRESTDSRSSRNVRPHTKTTPAISSITNPNSRNRHSKVKRKERRPGRLPIRRRRYAGSPHRPSIAGHARRRNPTIGRMARATLPDREVGVRLVPQFSRRVQDRDRQNRQNQVLAVLSGRIPSPPQFFHEAANPAIAYLPACFASIRGLRKYVSLGRPGVWESTIGSRQTQPYPCNTSSAPRAASGESSPVHPLRYTSRTVKNPSSRLQPFASRLLRVIAP
jgi:hypothetical protein